MQNLLWNPVEFPGHETSGGVVAHVLRFQLGDGERERDFRGQLRNDTGLVLGEEDLGGDWEPGSK